MKEVTTSSFGEMVRDRRVERHISQIQLAKLVGCAQATIDKIENSRSQNSRFLPKIFGVLGLPLEKLTISGESAVYTPPPSNATIGASIDWGETGERIPLRGQAINGKDGRFVFNGETLADILAPPTLRGVKDAYAVRAVGTSMEPRYDEGETLYVHPHKGVRKGDYVVIQIRGKSDGENPSAYIKRFISMDERRLRVMQFNPEKELLFPKKDVLSVHKIVLGGE